MKKIAIMSALLLSAQHASANNILDEYFNTPENGGELLYQPHYGYGKTSKGSDFNLCDSYATKRVPGDKITAITTYSGSEQLKGIKIEYLYADDETVGNTSGNGYRKVFGNTEYIQGYRFYKKRDGNISRIKLNLKDTANNDTRDIVFGGGNGWYKSVERSVNVSERSVIGFAGTAGSSTIWSIYPCTAKRLDLEEIDVTIHWDRISEKVNEKKNFFGESLMKNNSSLDQYGSTEVWYSYGLKESDSWTETLGLSVTAGVTLTQGYKVGVPSTVENSGSISFNFSETFSASTTIGGTSEQSTQKTLKQSIGTNVPAYGVMLARIQVDFSSVSVPYTSTVKNPHNGDIFKFTGVIEGSDYTNAKYDWDEIGYYANNTYHIFTSFAWVADDYGLSNYTIVADPVITP
ncbi:hypothetical protein OE749_08065 [Aestuariibacter sp. AA17]|uniref:Uncharacterized protein n=1 Tax=Fluctibacter corallii TaxID=2984329 RepID=A0ABT3A7J3_9ALTE|nr:hypothetical protein [Aestuariibacter sp. AA17]MCV2884648.1 hypothetical protein [Aestuariibacter sp. AA17]